MVLAAGPTALDYSTLAVAIVGGVTGLTALAAQVWQFVLSGPRVRVKATAALPTADPRWRLGINITNYGRLPVTITSIGVWVEKERGGDEHMPVGMMDRSCWQGEPLPHRLIDGEATNYYVEPDHVASGLSAQQARPDVRVYAQLATGKRIISRNRQDVRVLAGRR